jgi:hypothetical protein
VCDASEGLIRAQVRSLVELGSDPQSKGPSAYMQNAPRSSHHVIIKAICDNWKDVVFASDLLMQDIELALGPCPFWSERSDPWLDPRLSNTGCTITGF